MRKFLEYAAILFPVWVLVAGGLALVVPELFTWFDGSMMAWGLAVIMLGMGLNLDWDDFKDAFSQPKEVATGVILQYAVMPLAGFLIADGLQLPTPFAVGLILVASCPGGTASNIVTFLARANLPLSVLLTTVSTFLAMLATPLLTELYAGNRVPVDAFGLFLGTVKVVIVPVVLGIVLNRFAGPVVSFIRPATPLVAVLAVALIVGSIVGDNAAAILDLAPKLLIAVTLLHAVGFGIGYWVPLLLGMRGADMRTISIEVGMQNSGLGAVLAHSKSLANPATGLPDPLTAVPAALSAVMHSIIGSLLAMIWRLRPTREDRRRIQPGQFAMGGMR